MTLTPKHEQFVVDTGLDDHLADNSETLTEILTAIGDQKAMTALSNLLSGTACCARCHARDVRLVIECLCAAHDVPAASVPTICGDHGYRPNSWRVPIRFSVQRVWRKMMTFLVIQGCAEAAGSGHCPPSAPVLSTVCH
jgi:hypothetical protein